MEYKIYDVLKSGVYSNILAMGVKDSFVVLADNSRGVYIPQHVMGLFGIELDMQNEFYDDDFEEFENTVNTLLRSYNMSMGYTDNGDYVVTRLSDDN